MFDLILVGGGLANGLLAWRLAQSRPDVSFVLLEANSTLGGNHTWSFHGTDLTRAQLEWVWVLCSKSWPSHDVVFPSSTRRIGGGYHSITSADFHWKLTERLGDRIQLNRPVRSLSATHVELPTGERLEATCVIDGRGFHDAPPTRCGFQKFLGMEVELDTPHGLEVPLLMDTRVDQLDGFRFLYLLPWSERRLLVEDTVYGNTPHLEVPKLRARIASYLSGRGLTIQRVLREEAGALPIPLSGDAPRLEVPTVGVRAGLFHATTGYSLPLAVDIAEAIAGRSSFDAEQVMRWLTRHASQHWARGSFFRLLNRMLFGGTEPSARRQIFEAFYELPDERLARFYAGTLGVSDKLAILAKGAPTVPTGRAVRAAWR